MAWNSPFLELIFSYPTNPSSTSVIFILWTLSCQYLPRAEVLRPYSRWDRGRFLFCFFKPRYFNIFFIHVTASYLICALSILILSWHCHVPSLSLHYVTAFSLCFAFVHSLYFVLGLGCSCKEVTVATELFGILFSTIILSVIEQWTSKLQLNTFSTRKRECWDWGHLLPPCGLL